ncbi:ABC transporter ATP-binding protein [Streptococcus thermophilus MTCC 5460]|uniref:ABC transporter ATP-binding protein n=1 Tax=Streptococcus thermophilus TaxID=1308 RepID=UPI0002AEB487|nr:ATP-binding cassette domain-containing protein [Streptococcus thermophilus]ELW73706.1 ABC transporter ATP-binding protein [Streptococcus thermophilus MTCC 5461]ELW73780.1 ABC transporter ATP-binding protein [Streptococcus thermophilus MTCC 5460]
MSLIRLENVSLARQGKTLLSNLNWSVEKGQTWAILGLNGAGKSTLLRLLTAEFFPSEGHAEILGYTFGNGDITGLRKHIGIVSSFITERLPKHMTAEKSSLLVNTRAQSSTRHTGDKELQEAKDMLTSLGAGDLIGRKYHGLSQGEKQICLIARSLMEDPDIIILDEATVGLDLFAREKLLRQIDRISSLPHAPLVLYVTHHAEEITENMDHILLLRQGKIVAQGPKNDVITPEVLADFYQNPVQIIPIDDHRFYINPLL